MFTPMVEIIPEGKKGDAEVIHFEITQEQADFARLRAAIGHPREFVTPGRYAQLRVGGRLVMSDTVHEQRTNREFIFKARGNVLVGGLGLGMVLVPLLKREKVTGVTVIEKSEDAIALVAPHFDSPKLQIIHGDVFEWKPPRGTRYDTIYFDIWSNICMDNLPEMQKLRARFRNYRNPGSWLSSWEYDSLKEMKRRGWG